MGSTPNMTAGGTKMGMRMNMAAMASMNMPTTTKNRKINTMIKVVFCVTEPNQVPTMTGRPSYANTQAANLPVAAMNKMPPLERPVSLSISRMTLVLY